MNRYQKKQKLNEFSKIYLKNTDNFKINLLPRWLPYLTYELKKEIDGQKIEYYKRFVQGEVVLVNFGISIGSELCGPHFAVILNKKDTKYNSLLTVIPFSSKQNKKYVDLGRELILRMVDVTKKSLSAITNDTSVLSKELDDFKKTFSSDKSNTFTFSEKEKHMLEEQKLTELINFKKITIKVMGDNADVRRLVNKFAKIKRLGNYPEIERFYNKLSLYLKISDKIQREYLNEKSALKKANQFALKIQEHNKSTYAATNNIKTISKLRLINFYDRGTLGKIIISNDSFAKIKESIDNLI
jgi:mRNA-degrading endonuclease toxin of MazEF toxin-antitoxin module